MHRFHHDGVLVVGAGLAGLSAARASAPAPVLILTGAKLGQGCSSAWAQGGMAAALSTQDGPEQHAADTLAAGDGLVEPLRAHELAMAGPAAVQALVSLGVPFDRTPDGDFALSREAAHCHARVARVNGDRAGHAIMTALTSAVLKSGHVEVRAGMSLRALLQDSEGHVRGVVAEHRGGLVEVTARATIVATGGIGGLYAITTTPAELTGVGLGLAAIAGAQIADPEFVQFHPTAIDIGRDPAPLATEALRGEGAVLVDGNGVPFMGRYHPDADLAPRDVVARAVHAERRAGRGAFLDASSTVGHHLPERFPGVFAVCMSAGIDPRVQPIPIAPACHYHMGGIVTDATGATTLPGLYAAGEVASTGVHGANRLASNSLLEAAVFGARAGEAARDAVDPRTCVEPAPVPPRITDGALSRLRQAMSRDAGVVRDCAGLTRLLALIDQLEESQGRCPELVTARLLAACALNRTESRGAHFRSDPPVPTSVPGVPQRTFVTRAELEPAFTFTTS